MNSDPRMNPVTRNGVSEEELAKKAKGSRVTLADVEASIVEEHYFTAQQGADLTSPFPSDPSLALMTICVLVLDNGWTILGKSACADPSNYNKELGQRLARTDAVNQIWPLLGFQLRTQLHEGHTQGSNVDAPKTAFPVQGRMKEFGGQTYRGTKIIHAAPMSRVVYNDLRGWVVPADENPLDPGYIVEYADSRRPNVEGFTGYVSWSPKDVFDQAYREVKGDAPAKTAVAQPADDEAGKHASTPDWAKRLEEETVELTDRYLKLEAFFQTSAYTYLPMIERKDLSIQFTAMEEYLNILRKRLARYRLTREA